MAWQCIGLDYMLIGTSVLPEMPASRGGALPRNSLCNYLRNLFRGLLGHNERVVVNSGVLYQCLTVNTRFLNCFLSLYNVLAI
jgi:hypothetical protein